jgi:hypothetical protein
VNPPTPEDLGRSFAKIMRHRDDNGGKHLHHRNCIHNLPPEEQIAMRCWTVEKWLTIMGSMPEQITPEQWECEPPL